MSNKNNQPKWNDAKSSNPSCNEFKKPVAEKMTPEASSTFGAKKPVWNGKTPSNTPKK